MNFDYKFKVATIGDAKVGKSSLLNMEIYNSYDNYYNKTIGVNYFSKMLKIDSKKIKLKYGIYQVIKDLKV